MCSNIIVTLFPDMEELDDFVNISLLFKLNIGLVLLFLVGKNMTDVFIIKFYVDSWNLCSGRRRIKIFESETFP